MILRSVRRLVFAHRTPIVIESASVEKHAITGRELLILAKKTPVECILVHQKLHSGQMVEIGLDQSVDLREPGIERFVTMEASSRTAPLRLP